MNLLFVNACPRGEASRTLSLAETFLDEVQRLAPNVSITEQCLPAMHLAPVDAQTLAVKEPLCDVCDFTHAMFAPAVAFQQADAVVIAAPYWDMSFPSILKIWVENMYVRNLTFRYEDDKSVGLCQGNQVAYITTAGSPIGCNNWGADYIKAVMQTLGIPEFDFVSAEGLDLASNNAEAILADARKQAVTLAEKWAKERTTS